MTPQSITREERGEAIELFIQIEDLLNEIITRHYFGSYTKMAQPFTLEVLYNPQCTFSFKISVLERIGEGWKKRAQNLDWSDVLRKKLQELHGLLRTGTTEKNKSVPKILKKLGSLRNNFAHRAPIITNIGDSIAPQIPNPDNYSVEIDLQTVLTDFKKYQRSALADLKLINQHLDEFIRACL